MLPMRDGRDGQQVKIGLLSFWSVNRWVSQLQGSDLDASDFHFTPSLKSRTRRWNQSKEFEFVLRKFLSLLTIQIQPFGGASKKHLSFVSCCICTLDDQEEYEKMKEEMEGRINRLRAENSEKVAAEKPQPKDPVKANYLRWRSWKQRYPLCSLARWTWSSRWWESPQCSWHKLLLVQMKEEVEGEYAERMEGLREIYRFVKWFAFLMEFMMDKMNVCWR